MGEIVGQSERLVVMTERGRTISEGLWRPSAKIDLIAHGIPDMPLRRSEPRPRSVRGRAQEGAVDLRPGSPGGQGYRVRDQALPEIIRQHPDLIYIVLGATHPHRCARKANAIG